jgi:hypothetical protein
MCIRAIQTRAREPVDEPAKQWLVADVHAQNDVRLPSVASECPFADEHADQDSAIKLIEWRGHRRFLTACCFTVKKNVKR